MRFTKFCALVLSFAVTAFAQVVIQTPAPAPTPAPDSDDAKVREALRRALESEPGASKAPSPLPPAETTRPIVPTVRIIPPSTNVVTAYSYSTNIAGTNVTIVPLTLNDAIQLALQNNLMLRVERYNPIISDLTRLSLYGAYDPVLSAEYSHTHTERPGGGFNPITGRDTPPSTSKTDGGILDLKGTLPTGLTYDIGPSGNSIENVVAKRPGTDVFGRTTNAVTDTWDGNVGITMTQPLLRNFWIDETRLGIKLARRDVRIKDLELERKTEDIVNQVEKAYYGLIAAHELVRVGESDVAVKKQFFEEQQTRVRVGTLAPLDEKLAQSELALAQINLIVARKNAVDAENVLKGLIHDNFINQLKVRLDLMDKLLAIPPMLELFEAFKEAVEKRPDLQVERENLERNQIQLKFAFNQLFPSLDVFGTLRFNGLDTSLGGALDDIKNREFQQDIIGLRLSFPLTFFAERKKYKIAEAEKEQQIWNLKQVEETIVQEVDFQVRLLQTTWNTIPLRREQVAYQQAALEAEQKKLAAGKSTSFQVLQIASQLAQAQSDEVGTLRDYNQALSELAFRKGVTLERWKIDRPTRYR